MVKSKNWKFKNPGKGGYPARKEKEKGHARAICKIEGHMEKKSQEEGGMIPRKYYLLLKLGSQYEKKQGLVCERTTIPFFPQHKKKGLTGGDE